MVEMDDYGNSWLANGIYGWAERANKFKTWDLMQSLVNGVQVPYVFFGDFNEILKADEKEGVLKDVPEILKLLEVVFIVVMWLTWVFVAAPLLGIMGIRQQHMFVNALTDS